MILNKYKKELEGQVSLERAVQTEKSASSKVLWWKPDSKEASLSAVE